MSETSRNYVRWIACLILGSSMLALIIYHVTEHGGGDIAHLIFFGFWLGLALVVGFGKSFSDPAKDWIINVIVPMIPVDVKIGGRRKTDPPTAEIPVTGTKPATAPASTPAATATVIVTAKPPADSEP